MGVVFIYLLIKRRVVFLLQLFIIPVLIYLASYIPFFFFSGHHSPPRLNYSNFQTFIGLQQQMWWYHTQLKATHTYQSAPLQWIFDLRPVWLYVNYSTNPVPSSSSVYQPTPSPSLYTVHFGDTLWRIAQNKLGSGFRWKELRGYQGIPEELPIGTQIEIPTEVVNNSIPVLPSPNINTVNNSIASIFTLDNPLIPWFGLVSIIFLIFQLIKKFSIPIFFIVLAYLFYFVFWIKSPRIMFNYHYLPSTAFLTIAIGLVLNDLLKDKNGKILAGVFLTVLVIAFFYFHPIWVGDHLSNASYNARFLIPSWK